MDTGSGSDSGRGFVTTVHLYANLDLVLLSTCQCESLHVDSKTGTDTAVGVNK